MNTEELVKQIRELSAKLEAGSSNAAELKGKIAELEKSLEKNEAQNQALVAKMAKAEADAEATKTAMTELEKKLSRPANSDSKVETKAAMKALEKFVIGKGSLTPEEHKYLRTDIAADGGVLCPPEYDSMILKKITEFSPIRQFARVKPVSAMGLKSYTRDTLVTAYWTGEGEAYTESHSTYGQPDIAMHSITGKVKISNQELFASNFNMENEIDMDLAEEFARIEGQGFVTGDGVKKPYGLMAKAGISYRATGSTSAIPADTLLLATGDLKTGYKPMFFMNRKTVAYLRTLKSNDAYLWQPGNLAAGVPNAIGGYPYAVVPDMDDIGSDKYPVLFGDLAKAYLIIDGLAMSMLRNPYKEDGFVIFTAERFVGADIVMPEALIKIKCAMS